MSPFKRGRAEGGGVRKYKKNVSHSCFKKRIYRVAEN